MSSGARKRGKAWSSTRATTSICCSGGGAARLSIRYILLTHAHLDHITGVGRAKEALGAPVVLHRDDNFLYEAVVEQGQMFGFDVDPQPPVDLFYDGPGPWAFGSYAAWVHHTPGHCPGGVCLAVGRDGHPPSGRSSSETRCLRGRSAGRTCLAADLPTLLRSIREVLFSFPDETVVYSGHGEATTIGKEKTDESVPGPLNSRSTGRLI